MTTTTFIGRRIPVRAVGTAAALLAAMTLAACGDDADDTTTTTTTTPDAALEAAPPAMEAAPPAMEAAPPAMAAAPANEAAATITLANLVGEWAADINACATPSEVTTVTLTTFSGGGLTRTVSSTTPGADGLDVVLTGTVEGAPVTETWTFTPAGTAPPLTGVNVVMGGEPAVTWVRCPAPAPATPGLTPVP